VAANDVVRLSVLGTMFNQRVQYGHHFRFATAGGTMQGLATAYEAAILATLRAATSVDVTWQYLMVQDVRPTGPETLRHPLPAASVGQIAGEGAPPQTTAVISVHTGQKGRRRRGRFYVPGLAEAGTTGGNITGAQLTALTALSETLQTTFGATGTDTEYKLVVYSPEKLTFPTKPPPPPRPGIVTTPATDLILDPRVMTQRRRRLGVGE
jgi:hypothetical protein